MALSVQRIDGAVVRPLSASEARKVSKQEKRSPRENPHTLALDFPWVRRVAHANSWTLSQASVEASRSEPMRLPVDGIGNLGRSFWLIGEEVFSVNDLEVSPRDVLALVAARTAAREAQLRRAHAHLDGK